jgi:hypothetical protein
VENGHDSELIMLAISRAGVLVLVSGFYTAALEQPIQRALGPRAENLSLICVPYNQLHTFLLAPQSVIPQGASANVVILLRVEDLVRMELVALGHNATAGTDSCLQAFRERTEQLLDVLGRMSRLRLAMLICPAGNGAYDTKFLGNAIRVAEHKVAAELRRQQRHLVIGWSEFERAAGTKNCFNQAGDRLGHVPFSPEGLDSLAKFLVGQLDRLPVTTLTSQAGNGDSIDLDRFLDSLDVRMKVSPLTDDDERTALDAVRHTTHFVNVLNRKWESGDIRKFANRDDGAWAVRVRDRFGDYGVSGALTFRLEDDVMRVGLLFLTCPVLGRQVEYALMSCIATLAEDRGARFVEIPFTQGRDNHGMRNLLAGLTRDASQTVTTAIPETAENSFRLEVSGLADRAARQAPNPAGVDAILSKMQADWLPTTA